MLPFYYPCAQSETFFHIGCLVTSIGSSTEVVDVLYHKGFLRAGNYGTAVFQLPMMGKDAVDNSDCLFVADACCIEFVMEYMGGNIGVTHKVHVLGSLHILVILFQFAIIVEEDGDDATLEFQRREGGIETLKHVEQLVSVVE